MPIVVAGLNQQTAPVTVRERLAFPPDGLPAALARLHDLAPEAFILSTCNRVEVYGLLDASTDSAALARFLAESRDVPLATLAPHLYVHADADVVRHLFAVAAGLDSLVIGEEQILAQVRDALAAAQAAQALGPVFRRLGQTALATGKSVRARTAISRRHLSVVSVALRLATRHLGDLAGCSVLIVGAGRTAELTLKHLAKHPPVRLLIANRTAERAATLAARYGVHTVPWAELPSALAESDLVICCTSAPGPVLAAPIVNRALAARPARPLVLLDLAVPRDIDSAAAALPSVRLYDVDSLEAICAENRRLRAGEIAGAEALIAEAVEEFLTWWRGRAVAPTIAALRSHAEAVRDAEVARVLARLPDLDPAEEAAVRYLAESLVNKLLHPPVTALKRAPDGPALATTVAQLFGLSQADDGR